MRHHNVHRKFGRETDIRRAFLRSLASALILKEKIITTLPRAKEIRPLVEKLVTKAKKGDLAARRDIIARLGTKDPRVAKKLLDTLAAKYKDRAGGYLRITKISTRKSDAAPRAVVEFV